MKTGFVKVLSLVLVLVVGVVVYGCGGGGGGSLSDKKPAYITVLVDAHYQSVAPDGRTRVPIYVSVYTQSGDPADDVKVKVSADPNIGSFDQDIKSTNKGRVTFYYTVPTYDVATESSANKVEINVELTDSENGGISGNAEIYFKIYASKILAVAPADSTFLPADNNTSVPITVYVYRADGEPLSGIGVYAYAEPNIGKFDNKYASTDEAGMASFNYVLPSKEDAIKVKTDNVRLYFKNRDGSVISNHITISFSNVQVGNGIPASVMLSAKPSIIFTSNVSSGPKMSEITAKVVDSSGNPVDGSVVKFSLDRAPNGTYITPTQVTTKNGVAIANVISGQESGTAMVRAEVGDAIASSTILMVKSGEPSSITLTESGKVEAQDDNGTRTEGIYALVKDENGNPVGDGTAVMFT